MGNGEQINLTLLLTEIIFLVGGLSVWILFLQTQYRTLKAIKPANRLLSPGLVWLQFIPVFGLIWQFVVVIRLSASLGKEKLYRLEESLMSNTTAPAFPDSDHPTRATGLTYCMLTVAYSLDDLYIVFRPRSTFVSIDSVYKPGIGVYLITLAPVVLIAGILSCWIAYWISLARIRRQIAQRPTH